MAAKKIKANLVNKLKIIIVGCGKVGHTLTEQLAREGHDITIIDQDPQVLADNTEAFDVMGICGNGATMGILKEAGLDEADAVIAVTNSDELNLLCCTLAKKAGNNLSAIARVRNPAYADELPYLRTQLGLSMIINPEMESAREIARYLSRPEALTVNSFAKGMAELMRFRIPKGNILVGKKIMDLGSVFHFNFLFCTVERGDEVMIPYGAMELQEGDDVMVITSSREAHLVFSSIGMQTNTVRSVMIVGGGKTCYYLARQLLEQKMAVKIIETDRSRCENLTSLLPDALVLHGDASDEELLKESGIDSTEAFVALSSIDEENILLTLYAKRIPGIKTVCKINRITFNDVIDSLDLGSVVYPKYITTESIIAYIRAKQNSIGSNVETLYNLCENRVEAIEFHVQKDAPVVGIPLMQLKKKDGVLIACISRNGRVIFPRGQDVIRADDSVIIITTHTGLRDIADILQ